VFIPVISCQGYVALDLKNDKTFYGEKKNTGFGLNVGVPEKGDRKDVPSITEDR
jgi:hypothetical protein